MFAPMHHHHVKNDLLCRNGLQKDKADLDEQEFLKKNEDYDYNFEQLKEIAKELLFSGAFRSIRNNNGHTPLELLRD